LNHYEGPPLPYKLEVGGEWQAVMVQEGDFEEWLAANLSCQVWHSFSRKPNQSRIVAIPY
jgi:hypothetical protein